MKYMFIYLIFLLSQTFAQSPIEILINTFSKVDINKKWEVSKNKHQVFFSLTDTMSLTPKYSDPTPFNQLHNYTLSLTLEENWTLQSYESTRLNNINLIKPIRKRILAYYDSIGIGKTRRDAIIKNPMQYIRLVKNWSRDEKNKIKRIKILPNAIINETGVFYTSNNWGIVSLKQGKWLDDLFKALEVSGLNFDQNWFQENYDLPYQTQIKNKKSLDNYLVLHAYLWEIDTINTLLTNTDQGTSFRKEFKKKVLDTLQTFVTELNNITKRKKTDPSLDIISIYLYSNQNETERIIQLNFIYQTLLELGLKTKTVGLKLNQEKTNRQDEFLISIHAYHPF